MKVDLVGPTPPPLGGVSVHLTRLSARLLACGHEPVHHNPQRPGEHLFSTWSRYRKACVGDLAHIHLRSIFDASFFGMRARLGHPVVLTLHGEGLARQLQAASPLRRAWMRPAIRGVDAIIAVNSAIARFAIDTLGFDEGAVHVIPAFLPPDKETLQETPVPPAIESFLQTHSPVISANAFHLGLDGDVPLYGTDLLLELLLELRSSHPQAGVLLYVSCEEDHPTVADLRQVLADAAMTEHYHVVSGSRPFGPAMVRSSLLVRPTSTDGDAVSIREALTAGVPVVASDVVSRPEGVHAFEYRDLRSLVDTTRRALDADTPPPSAAIREAGDETFHQILGVYEDVLG
jgi:glycosyltransferase involved in cell wall biosynthesis